MSTTPAPQPSNLSNIISEIEEIANGVLTALETIDPALGLPAAIIAEVEKLASTALAAYSTASGTPITVASVQALLPNPTPLTPPTE